VRLLMGELKSRRRLIFPITTERRSVSSSLMRDSVCMGRDASLVIRRWNFQEQETVARELRNRRGDLVFSLNWSVN
jgi:hypothetical protein